MTRALWCPSVVIPSEQRDAAIKMINAGESALEFHTHPKGMTCRGFGAIPYNENGELAYPHDVCWRYRRAN